MSRLFKIGDAAKYLGVSVQTLRRWGYLGPLKPLAHKPGETRYYAESQLLQLDCARVKGNLNIKLME